MELTDIFTTFPILETERCILRASQPEDAADLFQIMGDARVTRYLGRPPLASVDDAALLVQRYHAAYQAHEDIRWLIVSRANEKVIGTGVLWHFLRPHFRAEIGYSLAPEWWRQGIITEVVDVMLDFGFTHIGLHSVEARIDPANTASKRVLEKFGFVQEGYFREAYYDSAAERFVDTAVFSLLKDNWLKRENGATTSHG